MLTTAVLRPTACVTCASPFYLPLTCRFIFYQHLPFTFSNRKAFAAKYLTFCLTGFSLPFIATGYQL